MKDKKKYIFTSLGPDFCPKCGSKMLIKDGVMFSWYFCPKCKFNKLKEEKKGGV